MQTILYLRKEFGMVPPLDDRRDSRTSEPEIPRLTGRFSYCSYAQNIFTVMFIAYNGPGAMMCARNLTKDEAIELTSKLNEELNSFRREFIEPNFIEGEE